MEKREKNTGSVSSVGNLAKNLLKNLGLEGSSKNRRINDAWKTAAGPEIAGHTRAVRLRNNVLTVEADSSALAAELNGFEKEALLERLAGVAGNLAILDLKFRIRRF